MSSMTVDDRIGRTARHFLKKTAPELFVEQKSRATEEEVIEEGGSPECDNCYELTGKIQQLRREKGVLQGALAAQAVWEQRMAAQPRYARPIQSVRSAPSLQATSIPVISAPQEVFNESTTVKRKIRV